MSKASEILNEMESFDDNGYHCEIIARDEELGGRLGAESAVLVVCSTTGSLPKPEISGDTTTSYEHSSRAILQMYVFDNGKYEPYEVLTSDREGFLVLQKLALQVVRAGGEWADLAASELEEMWEQAAHE